MTKKFIRKDTNKKKRIQGGGWRKPKGITNKMRLNRKGHAPNVRPGYGTPDNQRNKIKGLEIISVYNVSDIEKINPKTQCVLLGRVGKQKKLDMIKKAEELNLIIVNLKVDKFKKQTETFFKEREKVTKKKEEEKKKKEEEKKNAEKEAEKKEAEKEAETKKTEEINAEEKQKQEKKEKDKILTQKSN